MFADIFRNVDLIVWKSQCYVRGQLHHSLEAKVVSEGGEVIELGELTSERHPGRKEDREITFCDLMGLVVQDTAIALLAYRKTMKARLGTQIEVQSALQAGCDVMEVAGC